MLGNVSPRALRITSHPVVYSGRDNVTRLTLETLSGRRYVPLNANAVTRWVLVFPTLTPQVLIDSAVYPVFTASIGALEVDLSGFALDASIQPCWLIAYDAEHPNGQVLIDNADCVVAFTFRQVSGTGLVPLPLAQYLTDAPADGKVYARKDQAWVEATALVSGVASVNGQSGVVVLAAADVGALPATEKGAANGVASLDGTGKVPTAQLPAVGAPLGSATPQPLGTATAGTATSSSHEDHVHALPSAAQVGAIPASEKGTASGVATLDAGAKVPLAQLPPVGAQLGSTTPQALGVASAGVATSASREDHVHALPSSAQVGAVPASEKGVASGVATLDTNGLVPLAQLPSVAITDTFVVNSQAAMLALTAQRGDVAIRTDISSSFILQADPASTLANWQSILTPATGGGAAVGSAVPQPLGSATPGVSSNASREDHVHAMPSAANVGAVATSAVGAANGVASLDSGGKVPSAQLPALGVQVGSATPQNLGTAAAGVSTNASREDHVHAMPSAANVGAAPSSHVGATGSAHGVVTTSVDGFMAAADKTKLDGIAAGATANQTNTYLLDRTNHTGTQAISTVTGLQAALDKATFTPVIADATAARTFALTDAGGYVRFSSASSVTATVPAQASVAWVADTEINMEQGGTGGVTVVGAAGVTINGTVAGSFTLAGRYAAATLKRISTDTWTLIYGTASSGSGGAPVGSATPQPLGSATAGVSTNASREDHVHAMPTATNVGAVATSAVGVANGVASLDATGKVPTAQLPASTGAPVGSATPQPLGTATAGVATSASREDHVHTMPSKADVGLGNVDNTSDANKPVSTAQQSALDLKVNTSTVGAVSGVASLGADGKVPTAQLPALGAAVGSATPHALGAAAAGTATSASREDHVHAMPSAADVGAVAASAVGVANGVASLDSGGFVPLAQLPATAITDTFVVASEAAMLALTAQVGDIAIRTDISTSFILKTSPASTLANWQQILTPATGGGASVGSATPQALGTASPGVSSNASREDHVHAMPNAADVGAAPSSHVGATGTAHGVATTSVAGFMASTDKSKLDGVATGATANQTDAYLLDRANHTGSQAISTVTGLQTALDGKASLAQAKQSLIIACSDEVTALTAGTGKVTFRMPYAFTLSGIRASLTTAQTSGALLTVNVKESGVTILSTKITLDNTEKTSTTAATPPVLSDTALADDAEITVDIDQVGDGTAKGLKVTLIGTPA